MTHHRCYSHFPSPSVGVREKWQCLLLPPTREGKKKREEKKNKVPGPPLLPNVPQLFDIDVSGRKIKEMINKITEGQMKIISKNLAK